MLHRVYTAASSRLNNSRNPPGDLTLDSCMSFQFKYPDPMDTKYWPFTAVGRYAVFEVWMGKEETLVGHHFTLFLWCSSQIFMQTRKKSRPWSEESRRRPPRHTWARSPRRRRLRLL